MDKEKDTGGPEEPGYLQSILDGMAEPIVVISKDYRIRFINRAARDFLGLDLSEPTTCHEAFHGLETPCPAPRCPLVQLCGATEPMTMLHEHTVKGEKHLFEIFASPLIAEDGAFGGVIQYLHDVTAPVFIDKEAEEALEEKKTLAGIIVICAWCKRIRDARGNWVDVEAFIERHSEARFSHTICPDCLGKAWKDVGENP